MNIKFSVGLVIGRFQPFHKGHEYLIKKSLEHAEKIIIGIGSANVTNENNPYDFTQRKKMLEEFIRQSNLEDRIIKIFPSNDIPDDMEWAKKTIEVYPKIDIIISNNYSGVNVFFEQLGQKTLRIPYYRRNLYEGWKVRKLMKEGKNWKSRVPQYLIDFLENQ